MEERLICGVCGNEADAALLRCPYCNHLLRKPENTEERADIVRIVNLEKGMPVVEDALRRLEHELAAAAKSRIKVFVLIHGYGSGGKGGAIKDAVRKKLALYSQQGRLKDILFGENCGKRSGHAKLLLKRFPMLEQYVRHANPGITIVVI